MVWQVPQSTTTSDSIIVRLDEDGEGVFVARDVTIATVAANGLVNFAIYADGPNVQVIVAGVVAGLPLYLAGDNSTVTIEKSGELRSFYNQVVEATRLTDFTNHGLIKGYGINGLNFRSSNIAGGSEFTNSGTVDATGASAIYHDVNAIDVLTVRNSGTILGAQAFRSMSATAVDNFTNSGTATGSVELGGGADFYDGRLGRIVGDIMGEAGDDRLYAGSGDNKLYGGSQNDTLMGGAGKDLLDGGSGTDRASYDNATKGVVAKLSNATANSGDAAGDTYTSIEGLTGSDFGDKLTGSAVKNSISGGSGNDTVSGAGGSDTLTGGTGKDYFVFDAAPTDSNIDKISDFSFADDTIRLENSIFKAFTSTGTIASGAFAANTSGNAADDTDRIIYETDSGELYYDKDGLGGSSAVLFAKVGIGLGLTYQDFVII